MCSLLQFIYSLFGFLFIFLVCSFGAVVLLCFFFLLLFLIWMCQDCFWQLLFLMYLIFFWNLRKIHYFCIDVEIFLFVFVFCVWYFPVLLAFMLLFELCCVFRSLLLFNKVLFFWKCIFSWSFGKIVVFFKNVFVVFFFVFFCLYVLKFFCNLLKVHFVFLFNESKIVVTLAKV